MKIKCCEILPDNWDSSNPIHNIYKESSPWHPFSASLLKITASCSRENRGVGCSGLCDSYQSIEGGKKTCLWKQSAWKCYSRFETIFTIIQSAKNKDTIRYALNRLSGPVTNRPQILVVLGGGGVLKGFFYTIIEIELRSFCLIQIKSGDVNGVAVRRSYPDIDGELHGTNLG